MGYIILVRHGQARNNVEKRLSGRMDGVPLTDEGRQQAADAAAMLADMKVSAIHTSPIERAATTANILGERCGITPQTDERLTEIDMGKFTGMTFEEMEREHGNIFAKFYDSDVAIAHKGVETFEQVRKRILHLLWEVNPGPEADENVVLVTHRDPIVAVLSEALTIPPQNFTRMNVENASLNVFAGINNSLTLLAWNLVNPSRFITAR